MLRTIEARYDHGKFIFLEKFPEIETASLLITILDGEDENVTQPLSKVASFTRSLRAVAGVWKDKKIDVDAYVRDMRKDREI